MQIEVEYIVEYIDHYMNYIARDYIVTMSLVYSKCASMESLH